MKDRVLTICPSIRPKRLEEMKKSWEETQTCSDLIVDTTPGTTTEIINKVFRENPDYGWYHIANDDFIYHTKGWDETLKSDGIAYANDGFLKKGLCTISVINGDLPRALGWLQLPAVDFLYGDNVWMCIGDNLGKLHYFKNVIIEHKHFIKQPFTNYDTMITDNSLADAVYQKTNSREQFKKDGSAFAMWIGLQFEKDLRKIKYGSSSLL